MNGEERTDGISDWTLERYRLAELSPEEQTRLDDRISDEPKLRERLEELAISDVEIRRAYPAEVLAPKILARAPTRLVHRRAPAGCVYGSHPRRSSWRLLFGSSSPIAWLRPATRPSESKARARTCSSIGESTAGVSGSPTKLGPRRAT